MCEINISNDVELITSDKAVIYFTLSKSEYEQINEEIRWQTDEVLSDFYFYKNKVSDYLKNNNIEQILTVKKQVIIQNKDIKNLTYNKSDFDHVVGIIMVNGQKDPKVFLGVGTDTDLIEMFKAYFEIQ